MRVRNMTTCYSPYCMHHKINKSKIFEDSAEFDHVQYKLHEAIINGEILFIKKLLKLHDVNEAIQVWKYCTVFSNVQKQVGSFQTVYHNVYRMRSTSDPTN